jgi:hypothetical protein
VRKPTAKKSPWLEARRHERLRSGFGLRQRQASLIEEGAAGCG